jgi:hypothetical protein
MALCNTHGLSCCCALTEERQQHNLESRCLWTSFIFRYSICLENTKFRELILFQRLRLAPSKGHDGAGVSLHSLEDGNISNF